MNKKGDLMKDWVGWLILGALAIALIAGIIFVLAGKANAATEFFSRMVR